MSVKALSLNLLFDLRQESSNLQCFSGLVLCIKSIDVKPHSLLTRNLLQHNFDTLGNLQYSIVQTPTNIYSSYAWVSSFRKCQSSRTIGVVIKYLMELVTHIKISLPYLLSIYNSKMLFVIEVYKMYVIWPEKSQVPLRPISICHALPEGRLIRNKTTFVLSRKGWPKHPGYFIS